MPFEELRGLERELFIEKQIEELRKAYQRSQKRLLAILNQVDITDFNKARTQALLVQVNAEIIALNKLARNWAKEGIPEAYRRGFDLSAERLKKMNVTRFVSFDAKIHSSAVSTLIDDVTVTMLTANQTIKNNFSRFIRTTQQRILEDKEISKNIAAGLIQGEPRRAISDTLLNEFRKQLGNEQFITINGRNYRPDAYSRLVARTRTREASTQASINTGLQYGLDLQQVDVHTLDDCDVCKQYMGRIYSVSGSHPDFPRLTEKPPFHPNCKCNLIPVTIESLEERGILESAIKLSNSPNAEVDSFAKFQELIGTY